MPIINDRFMEIKNYIAESVEAVVADYASWGWADHAPATTTTAERIRRCETPEQLLAVITRETSFGDAWGPWGPANDMICELYVSDHLA